MGFEDGKSNPGIRCPSDHSVNFCAGWNTSAGNPPTKTTPRVAKVTEIALGAAPGPHTLEYIQAFNIAVVTHTNQELNNMMTIRQDLTMR